MARVVRKYGGSSLSNVERIRNIASHLADLKWQGDEVVVVVSGGRVDGVAAGMVVPSGTSAGGSALTKE